MLVSLHNGELWYRMSQTAFCSVIYSYNVEWGDMVWTVIQLHCRKRSCGMDLHIHVHCIMGSCGEGWRGYDCNIDSTE